MSRQFALSPAAQPIPRVTRVSYSTTARGHETIIARAWDSDPRGRCGLCPPAECSVDERLCQIKYHEYVPPESAALFVPGGRADGPGRPGARDRVLSIVG